MEQQAKEHRCGPHKCTVVMNNRNRVAVATAAVVWSHRVQSHQRSSFTFSGCFPAFTVHTRAPFGGRLLFCVAPFATLLVQQRHRQQRQWWQCVVNEGTHLHCATGRLGLASLGLWACIEQQQQWTDAQKNRRCSFCLHGQDCMCAPLKWLLDPYTHSLTHNPRTTV